MKLDLPQAENIITAALPQGSMEDVLHLQEPESEIVSEPKKLSALRQAFYEVGFGQGLGQMMMGAAVMAASLSDQNPLAATATRLLSSFGDVASPLAFAAAFGTGVGLLVNGARSWHQAQKKKAVSAAPAAIDDSVLRRTLTVNAINFVQQGFWSAAVHPVSQTAMKAVVEDRAQVQEIFHVLPSRTEDPFGGNIIRRTLASRQLAPI